MRIDGRDGTTREEKLQAAARKQRRRRSNIRVAIGLVGLLALLVVLMYGGVLLYTSLTKPEDAANMSVDKPGAVSGADAAVSGGDAAVSAGVAEITYTQAELEARIAEAISTAQSAEADRVLEGIKAALSEGTSTVETLRPYYPNELVVVSNGAFHFVPINYDLEQNELDPANLNILESGEFQYLTDGQVTSHKGIDVSSHQGDINWNEVAQDGVEFAIIRAVYRGYGTGKLVEDEKFEQNIKGAAAAGIKVGVYVFSQAINQEELLEEANMVLEKIAPYQIDCPVIFDVERVSGTGRMNEISVEERTNLTLLFCQTIENAGYKPMIYHNTEMGALMLDLAALEGYEKWYASYSDKMFYPYEYKIWQYSAKGRVNGISGDVDLNISFAPVWPE